MPFLKFLLLVSGAVFCAQGQPFRPFLHSPVEHGATELRGNYHGVPAGVAPAFTLYVCATSGCGQVTPGEFAINLAAQTFSVTLKPPVQQGQFVRVELTAENTTTASKEVTVNQAPTPTVLEPLSAQLIYGAAKATIFFKPVGKAVGKPSLQVELRIAKGLLFSQNVEPNEEALKAGKVEFDLKRPAFDDEDESLQMKVAAGTAEIVVGARPAVLEFNNRPIREGDMVVAGKTASKGVKRVCIAVFGPTVTGDDAAKVLSMKDVAATQCADAARRTVPGQKREMERQLRVAKANKARAASVQVVAQSVGQIASEVSDYLGDLLMEQEVNVDAGTGTFEFKLDRPLIAGAKIVIREVFPEIEGQKRIALTGPRTQSVQSVGLDYGRVRGVFSLGAVVGQSQDAFAKADPYFSAYFEGNFFSRMLRKRVPRPESFDTDQPERYFSDLFNNAPFGAALHWFADARLTGTGAVTPVGGVPSGLTQAQSAVFQLGFYAPMRVKGFDWVYRGEQFTAFVAPLVKGGVTVLKDGATLGRTKVTTTTSVKECPPAGLDCSALNRSVDPKEEFLRAKGPAPFTGIGMRTGVMKYEMMGNRSRNRQLTGDPQIYIDLTYGQDQAYTTPGLITTTTSDRDNTLTGLRTRTVTESQGYTFEPRISVEGRAKLPFLPAQLGVDINMNRRAPLRSVAGAPEGAKESVIRYTDFRFLVAFRIDAMKALGRVFDGKK